MFNTDTITVHGTADEFWNYTTPAGKVVSISAPVFEIDGVERTAVLRGVQQIGDARELRNGCREVVYAGTFADDAALTLELIVRLAPDNPVIRFCYRLSSSGTHRMTKMGGSDNLRYLGISLREFSSVKAIALSEFNEMVHSYLPQEYPLAAQDFAHARHVMGPMLVAENATTALLLAYEHGSTAPDAFLQYHLTTDRRVELYATKGNYFQGQTLGSANTFQTIWFDVAAVDGDEDALAAAFRNFMLHYQSENSASRRPYIFYNTWAFQERNKCWNGQAYLDSMQQERIMQEIEVAHRMGIDVFVLDTGWYEKTGDWQVDLRRFPDGMKSVKAKLDEYGMKLGLWFGPLHAAMSSRMLAEHADCCVSQHGEEPRPFPVWETEESVNLCLASRYADGFADELIRLAREVGVSYFKWDAVGQYGCDKHGHGHGGEGNSAQERGDCFAFEMPRAMAHVVDRLCEACPESIVDFDITEGGRCVGLGFLAAGKYFLINNGPYFNNYDMKMPKEMWSNIFVNPGPARGWICRTPLAFDKWIPSVLFLTHYLPDDPANSQRINIASLILGHNGIWGDLLAISDEGVARFGRLLALYKQVRDDITRSTMLRTGAVSGSPEIYEKIDPASGRGCVVIFGGTGKYEYSTQHRVDAQYWAGEGTSVTLNDDGTALILAQQAQVDAQIVFFGVNEA